MDRRRHPGGLAAKTAFDVAVALGQGKKIQDAAFAAAGGVLPKSPYAASALSFAGRVAAGEDIRKAALSTAGNAVVKRLAQQGVNVLGARQRRVPGPSMPRFAAREAEWDAEAETEAGFEAASGAAMSGHWLRRGDRLVLLGA